MTDTSSRKLAGHQWLVFADRRIAFCADENEAVKSDDRT